MSKGYDWTRIELEYFSTDISQKKIAEKYKVPIGTIQDRARKNHWSAQRKEFHEKTVAKSLQKIEKNTIERISTIMRACDRMTEVIERALEDPDMFYKVLVENKKTGRLNTKKTKIINTKGLKEMSGAIKDMLEVYKSDEGSSDSSEITINVIDEEFKE